MQTGETGWELFIYVATFVRFIFDNPDQGPQRLADFLLSGRADPEEHPCAHLDALFLNILQQALPLGASNDKNSVLQARLGLKAITSAWLFVACGL